MTVTDDLLEGKQQAPPSQAPSVVEDLLTGVKPAPPKPVAPERDLFGRAARFLGDWNLSAAQGATFGYSDEIAAWVGSQIGLGEYDELLGKVRKRHKEIPAAVQIPGEIAGGIGSTATASVLGGPLGTTAAGGKIAAGAAKLPGWLKAMGMGGLFGGAYGSGTAEGDLEDRARAAAIGAAVGAAGAGVLHPVEGIIRRGAGAAGAQIRARLSPEKEALAQIKRAFARDEMTPAKLRVRLRELGPQATIADAAGKNTQVLARTASGTPGPAQNRIEQVLRQRASSEGDRIVRAINRGVDFDDFYAAEEAFLKNVRERAAPLYDQAYAKHETIMTPALKRIIRSRAGRDAMKEVADILEIERGAGQASYLGKVDQELTEALRSAVDVGKVEGLGRIQPGVIKGFSLRTWDQIKRGFDALLDRPAYRNELTGRLNTKGRAVYGLKKSLLRELDNATGGKTGLYARARKVYGGDAEVLDGLREGRKAMTKAPEVITKEMGDLSEAASEAYRSGAARALRDIVESVPDQASAANRLFGRTIQRRRIRALFPDEADFQNVRRVLVSEQRFGETKNLVLSGSQTREKLSAERDMLQKAAGAAAVMSGSGGEIMLASMRRKAAEALFGPQNEKFLADIAKMLVNRNPAMNQHAIDMVFGRMGMANAPAKVKQEAASYLVPLIVGQQTGRAAGQ